jgi:transposase
VGGDHGSVQTARDECHTLRNWIRRQQVDDGKRDGVSSEAAAEIRALRRRNAELEQTIEILKAATSFFVRESDPRSRH